MSIKRIRSTWDEDESIYTEEARDQMVEDDELSPMEAAFMQGWDEAV